MLPERLADGIYLVPLTASNVYIWQSDGILSVVDTGVPGSADAILEAVRATEFAMQEVAAD